MKKVLLTLFLITTTAIAFAQTVTFGIKGGINMATQTFINQGTSYPNQYKSGFQLGGIADFTFKNFAIQPGIFFITKGKKETNLVTTFSSTLNYIEVPVNLLYKLHAAPDLVVYFGGGPFLGYGLGGTQTDGQEKTKITFDDDHFNVLYKNPDYGLNFIAGAEFGKHILLDAGYSLGLANIAYDSSVMEKNRVITVGVGYMFR
ncbi:MAG TPA: porin family protein [Mucilaginibacter sp.]|nr:porin family protein [Mucilaginibacter sp.]